MNFSHDDTLRQPRNGSNDRPRRCFQLRLRASASRERLEPPPASSPPHTALHTARKSAPAATSGARIVRRDPADRDAGDLEHRRPPAQDRPARAGAAPPWSWSDRRRRTRHSRPPPRPLPSPGGGCRGRSRRSAHRGPSSARASRGSPSSCPRCTPSAPSRLASADAVVDDERDVAIGADALQRLGQRAPPRAGRRPSPGTGTPRPARRRAPRASRSGKPPPTSSGEIR